MDKICFIPILFYVSITQIWCHDCMIFDVRDGYRIDGSHRVLQERSQITCAFHCFKNKSCKSANFNRDLKLCELTEESLDTANARIGWVVLGRQACHQTQVSDDGFYEEKSCGRKLVHECRHGYISTTNQTSAEVLSCSQLKSTKSLPNKCVPGTCKEVLLDNPNAETGNYIYKDPNGTEVVIFCDFRGSHGYTFFSSTSLANLSSLEPHFTTSAEAIIHHFRSDGSQTEATMKILSRYRNQYNLTFLLNTDFDGSQSGDVDKPFLSLGFVPQSFGDKKGTKQGYNVQDNDIEYTNCDNNHRSSIKFFLTGDYSVTPVCCNRNDVKSAWYEQGVAVEPVRYLSMEFAFKFRMRMGGCGASVWSDSVADDLHGAALGLKFCL